MEGGGWLGQGICGRRAGEEFLLLLLLLLVVDVAHFEQGLLTVILRLMLMLILGQGLVEIEVEPLLEKLYACYTQVDDYFREENDFKLLGTADKDTREEMEAFNCQR